MDANRIGVIAVIIEDHRHSVAEVNEILSEYAGCVRARMGVPNQQKDLYVISLIVEVTTEQLGAITGRLGNLPGVTVKSALTNKSY